MLLVDKTFKKYGYYIGDFTEMSSKIIIIQCDYCGDIIEKPISAYNLQRKNSNKDSCNKKECRGKKLSETKLRKSGIKDGYRKCPDCKEIKELNGSNFPWDNKKKNKYKRVCKPCAKTRYHTNKTLKLDKKYSLEESILIYNEAVKNSEKLLPQNFFERLLDEKGLIDYILKVKTNAFQGRFKNFTTEFTKNYKLYFLVRKYKSHFEFINHYYPNYIKPWQLEKSPQGYWNDDNNVLNALEWFIDELIKDRVIEKVEDLPRVCTYDLAVSYNLGGLVSNRFNYSIFQTIDFLFPDKFHVSEFNLPVGFYNNKENRLYILQKFIDSLIKDTVIKSIEEIPDKVNIYTFGKYNLRSFLQHVYQGITFAAMNELFPNKWKVWEFKSCPTGFWEKKENLYEAIEWLVEKLFENSMIKNISELPSVFSYKLFSHFGMARLYDQREVVYEYLSNKYSNELIIKDFNLCIANDGTKCLSKQEVILHNLFLENNINAKYCTKTTLFYNNIENERYSPDWIIDDIIVEYFGLYVEHYHNSSLLTNYKDKTERKIEYYNSLKDYRFIALYPSDFNNGFEGLIKKFNQEKIKIIYIGSSQVV